MINNRQNNRRRGRGGGGPRPNGANPGNDRGNRIDNRARGNASQLHEKYKTLARDAQMQGDRVMSEYYFQFADHYFRVLSESRSRFEEQNRGRPDQNDRDDQYDDGDDGDIVGEPGPSRFGEREYARQQDYNRQQNGQSASDAQQPPAARTAEEPAPYANGRGGEQGEASQDEPVRRGRGRRPAARKEEGSPDLLADFERPAAKPAQEETRIEVDRLPPAFAAPEEAADKPKRRGRPRRSESPVAEV